MYRYSQANCILMKRRGRAIVSTGATTVATTTDIIPSSFTASKAVRFLSTVAAALLITHPTACSSFTFLAEQQRYNAKKKKRTMTTGTLITTPQQQHRITIPNQPFSKRSASTARISSSIPSDNTSNNSDNKRSVVDNNKNDDDDDENNDGEEKTILKNMLYRIRQVNYMPDDIRKTNIDFYVDGIHLGKVRPKTADLLCRTHDINNDSDSQPVFCLVRRDSNNDKENHYLTLTPEAGSDFESRSKSVAEVMEQLRDQGIVKGWRNELYPVSDGFYNPPLFAMERAAVPFLGILEYGVHINGLVRNCTNNNDSNQQQQQQQLMWMARRSQQKPNYPGMLDHIVAGGQPVGMSLEDNVVKECFEEAGIPEELARQGIQPAGAISYEHYLGTEKETISRVILFCYDLYLPPSFQPKPMDGEVDSFFLWNIDQVKQSMAADFHDPIKPNCYIVIIDYLLRNGFLSPDVPGYLDILRELRSGDCY